MKPLKGPELLPAGKVKNVVIFLHGLGSNGDDLLGLASMILPTIDGTAFLAPNAPLPVPMTFNGWQWFELWDRSWNQIEQGVRTAAPLIVDFIKATAKRFEIGTENIALVGFSQGTMMSLHAGLRLISPLAGIVGFSGAMISPETLMLEKLPQVPPVLLVHGTHDPVVPLMASQQAAGAIKIVGGDVRLVERPFLVHTIDDVGIKEATRFLKDRFANVS